ncbi:MAG TPA: hypothetical protein DCL61_31955 [Cyanobacteria bacterium UBA12227]|nr:hypothetical protein [Cyanobacteria bacterium UBA12227]HAX85224.1 hypothetical protein [Cyanobacteria bacterium UBA11370]HBY76419.1 hypothetical protein [Cyanobacteria bacterium UBA11148]
MSVNKITDLIKQVEALKKQVEALKNKSVERRQKYSESRKKFRAEYKSKYKIKRQEIIQENRALRKELQKVIRYQYGSFTPGIQSWQEKWSNSPGKRVLLYALKDYSGSFMKWAIAINEFTPYAARLIAFGNHQYGYDVDLIFPMPNLLDSDFLKLAEEADLIHIKDEIGFFEGSNQLPPDLFTQFNKPLIFTHYGGKARKFQDNTSYQNYVASFAARIALTPDLCYPWFDGYFIPQGMDTEKFQYSWKDGRLLAHSPSTSARKGTDNLLKAIQDLDIEFDLIHGVSHPECLARKKLCNLFFDQAGREVPEKLGIDDVIGWYGNSALEAAVHGIPTIAHLSDEAFKGAKRGGKDIKHKCAIINTPLDAEGIRETISKYFELSSFERKELSQKTRAWVKDFHSFSVVAKELQAVYDQVLK